jgi:hypothetical protein
MIIPKDKMLTEQRCHFREGENLNLLSSLFERGYCEGGEQVLQPPWLED